MTPLLRCRHRRHGDRHGRGSRAAGHADPPEFDRNLNTGGRNFDEAKGVVARNVVHHSKQYPSSITVAVIK